MNEVEELIKQGVSPEKIPPDKLEAYNIQDVSITTLLFILQVLRFGPIEEVLCKYMEKTDA